MDLKINELLINNKDMAQKLIELYQAELLEQHDLVLSIALEINEKLIDSNLKFASVANSIIRRAKGKASFLHVVK